MKNFILHHPHNAYGCIYFKKLYEGPKYQLYEDWQIQLHKCAWYKYV